MKEFFLFIFFLPFFLLSQNENSGTRKADSLLAALKKTNPDTTRVKTLLQLAEHAGWRIGDFDTALYFAGQAKQLAEKLAYKKGMANACNTAGIAYAEQGNFTEALQQWSAALKIYETMGDKKGIGSTYNNIGLIQWNLGNYPEALRNHFASLKMKEAAGDKHGVITSYNNIGLVYADQGNHREALRNYFTVLKMMEQAGDKEGIATSYNNIALIQAMQHNYKAAIKNHQLALKLRQELGDKKGVADSYNNLGVVYGDMGDGENSLANYQEALKIRNDIGDQYGTAYSYSNIGIALNAMSKPAEAKTWLKKALTLSKQLGIKGAIRSSYGALAHADSLMGNFKEAYESYYRYIIYRDSILNEENTKKTVQQQMQYEFDRREEAARAEQDKKDAITAEKAHRQQVIAWIIGGSLAIVLVFAIGLMRTLKLTRMQKAIIEEQKRSVEVKQKEILDSIHYAKRIQSAIMTNELAMHKNLGKARNSKKNNK